jgi:hypothetical protein
VGGNFVYFDLNDSDLSSNVAYYVEGSGEGMVADRLKLVLNVYSDKGTKKGNTRFLLFASSLWEAALNQPIPDVVTNAILTGKEIQINIGNKKASLFKNKWQGHKFNGYDLEFTIRLIRPQLNP